MFFIPVSQFSFDPRNSCPGYRIRFIKASYEVYECCVHGIDSRRNTTLMYFWREDEPGEFVNNENSIRQSCRSSPRNFSFRVKCSAAYECSSKPRVYPAGNSKFKLFLQFFSYPRGYSARFLSPPPSSSSLPGPFPLPFFHFFFLSLSRVCIFHDASEFTVEFLARNFTGSFIRLQKPWKG